jgi:hypothetical protein
MPRPGNASQSLGLTGPRYPAVPDSGKAQGTNACNASTWPPRIHRKWTRPLQPLLDAYGAVMGLVGVLVLLVVV